MPARPSSATLGQRSFGIVPSASQVRACGAMCSAPKARAMSKTASCSSLSAKSMVSSRRRIERMFNYPRGGDQPGARSEIGVEFLDEMPDDATHRRLAILPRVEGGGKLPPLPGGAGAAFDDPAGAD